VKCQLVNTVDSSNITTPIIGLVTDDLWWNGKIIVRANSEVHGVANVDRVRERIAGDGEFTFVLNEPDGAGRELVVHGMVLDMEKDDGLDSYGITDGSAGLRGDVIRTANSDVIKLYAASLISGIAGAFSSNPTGVLGNRVYTNNSALGLSALQGLAVNPTVGARKVFWTGTPNKLSQASNGTAFLCVSRRESSFTSTALKPSIYPKQWSRQTTCGQHAKMRTSRNARSVLKFAGRCR